MNNVIRIPDVTFRTRVKETLPTGEYIWKNVTSEEIFNYKRVVVFALPGAFTPTCTTQQLPAYETRYHEFKQLGIDEVYCLSVNDSFVMNAWFDHLGITQVKPLPDGSGEFTAAMGMLVNKANLGFGNRSWRYSMLVDNGEIQVLFEEPGKMSLDHADPYGLSGPSEMISWLSTDQTIRDNASFILQNA